MIEILLKSIDFLRFMASTAVFQEVHVLWLPLAACRALQVEHRSWPQLLKLLPQLRPKGLMQLLARKGALDSWAAASEARRRHGESPMAFWDVVVVRRQRDTETLRPTEVKEFIKGLGSVEDFLKADGCQAHSGPYFPIEMGLGEVQTGCKARVFGWFSHMFGV